MTDCLLRTEPYWSSASKSFIETLTNLTFRIQFLVPGLFFRSKVHICQNYRKEIFPIFWYFGKTRSGPKKGNTCNTRPVQICKDCYQNVKATFIACFNLAVLVPVSPVRYVSIIQSNIESGPKMIQFNIQLND